MKTINDLKNQDAGTYVSGSVAGRISSAKNIETKTGKTMSVAKLGDDNDTVDLQSFDLNLLKYNDKEVVISGKGIKRDEYNGYAKVVLGKSVKIDVGGDAPASAPIAQSAPASKASTNHPATVGLAAKIIVDLERIRNESIRIYNEAQIARGKDELALPDGERLSPNSGHWDKDLATWIERLQKAERGEL